MIGYFFSVLFGCSLAVALVIAAALLLCAGLKHLDRRDFLLEPFDCYPEPADDFDAHCATAGIVETDWDREYAALCEREAGR